MLGYILSNLFMLYMHTTDVLYRNFELTFRSFIVQCKVHQTVDIPGVSLPVTAVNIIAGECCVSPAAPCARQRQEPEEKQAETTAQGSVQVS